MTDFEYCSLPRRLDRGVTPANYFLSLRDVPIFNVQRSTFDVRRSTFDVRPRAAAVAVSPAPSRFCRPPPPPSAPQKYPKKPFDPHVTSSPTTPPAPIS